jgi:dolichyl-phosphate beta-glucosyltransferase
MTACELVLVVPCYNEANRLPASEFVAFVQRHPSIRFLLVDDGSRDGTAAVHERMVREAPSRIRALRFETNHDKAEAVRRGLLEAVAGGPALVGFWDADLSTPLTAIHDFLAVAAKHPEIDLILGSRVMLMGRDIRRRAIRHYFGRVFATAASLALDLPVYDTQCGAKVFRVNEALRRVLSTPFRSSWIFDVEILARYIALPIDEGGRPRQGRIYELAVPAWHDVPGSKLKAWDCLRAVVDLLAIWRGRRATEAAAVSEPTGQPTRRG